MMKMFKTEWLFYYTLAGVLRFLLMKSRYQEIISDRVEVSTSLNSWKRGFNFLNKNEECYIRF